MSAIENRSTSNSSLDQITPSLNVIKKRITAAHAFSIQGSSNPGSAMKTLASNSGEEKVNDCPTLTANRTVQKPINLDYTNTFKEIESNVDKGRSILIAANE